MQGNIPERYGALLFTRRQLVVLEACRSFLGVTDVNQVIQMTMADTADKLADDSGVQAGDSGATTYDKILTFLYAQEATRG